MLISVPLVEAAGLGLSPAKISARDVLRGGHYERQFKVSTTSDDPSLITVALDDPNGEIASWLSFDPPLGTYEASRGEPLTVLLKIDPPDDVPNGVYTTQITVFGQTVAAEGTTGAAIQGGLGLILEVEISDFEVRECKVSKFSLVEPQVGQPLLVSVESFNNGNVQERPDVDIKIYDKLQKRVLQTVAYNDIAVPPVSARQLNYEVETGDLPPGQYWAQVSSENCGRFTDIQSFNIKSFDQVEVKGLVGQVKSTTWTETYTNVPISVEFSNIGEAPFTAHVEGEIIMDGTALEQLETKKKDVPPGATVIFEMDYVPTEYGIYDFIGRVFFGDQVSREVGTRFNVNDNPDPEAKSRYEALVRGQDPDQQAPEATEKKSSSSGMIIRILLGAVLVVALIVKFKRKKKKN